MSEMEVSVTVTARDHEAGDTQELRIEIVVPPVPAFGASVLDIQVRSVGLSDPEHIRSLLSQIAELINGDDLKMAESTPITAQPGKAKPFNPGAPKS